MKELKDVLHYYLPYKLKCQLMGKFDTNNNPIEFQLQGIEIDSEGVKIATFEKDKWSFIEDVFPILHPLVTAVDELSEFTYENQVESFDSVENAAQWFKIVMHHPLELPFARFEKALSLHCDLFGLIESEQAIEK
jgi:hypothetical protein